jgi:hypothetical protein
MTNSNCYNKFGDKQQPKSQKQPEQTTTGHLGEKGGVGCDGVAGLGYYLPPPPTHLKA